MFGFASSGQVCHPLEDLRMLVPQAPEVNESTLFICQQGRQAQRGRGIPPRSHIRSNEPPDAHMWTFLAGTSACSSQMRGPPDPGDWRVE